MNRNFVWRLVLGFIAAFAVTQVGWAQDPAKKAAGGDSTPATTQESAKIEPYTGPPVFLEESAQVAAPTLVTRQKRTENYEDGKTVRVDREIALYSDNSFAADGYYREFHPNGKPFIEGQFVKGRQQGDWTYYFDNGTVNRKVTYNDGKPNGSWEIFRADGTLSAKRGFKDGLRDGEWFTYDATGKQPLTEEHYIAGTPESVWKTWYPNGKQKQQMSFKDGKRSGTSTEWDDKGQKIVEVNYADNKLDGTATRWLPDGRTVEQKYEDGRFVSETRK